MKLNQMNFMAYPYGKATPEQLQRIYENYGIASVCDGDDNGYYVIADELKEA